MTENVKDGWDLLSEPFLVGDFTVDPATHSITKSGSVVKLEPRAMELLLYLVNRPGTVVSREELEREVWKDMVVGYDALNNTVAKLRKAFKDNPKKPQFIRTVSKKGYQLIAEVGVSPLSGEVEHLPSGGSESLHDLERKLAAIVYADVADYSRLTGLDENGTHRSLSKCLDLMTALIERYHGNVVHFAGDAVLAEFSTASNALGCAATMQQELAALQQDVADDRKMKFRIGVNLGEVIVDRNDIYGDGVNVAARLEGLAEPGGICLSGTVFDAIGHQLPLDYNFLGERLVKNIDKPVRAYQARLKPGMKLEPPSRKKVSAAAPGRTGKSKNIVAMLILLAVLVAVYLFAVPQIGEAEGKPALAVLSFENLSDDPAQNFYAAGLTGDLTTDFSKLSGLSVIARHSVVVLESQKNTLEQIAEELNVGYVLEGNVRRVDGIIRINVSLIDVSNSQGIWSERYEGDESELFLFLGRIKDKVISKLAIELTPQEQQQRAIPTTSNLEAWDYFSRAEKRRFSDKELDHEWVEDIHEAIRLYREAIELDSEFAQAHIGLAWIGLDVWRLAEGDVLPPTMAKKLAYDSVTRINQIDPLNPAAFSVLAVLQAIDGQHEIALASSLKAVELGPNDADAWIVRGEVLLYAGQLEEALAAIDNALELNPKPSPDFYGVLGRAQYLAGQYQVAEVTLEMATWYRDEKMMTYGQLGQLQKAKAFRDKRVDLANLDWYRAIFSHYRRLQDRQHMIDGLRKAGVPEHAFGFEGNPQDRVDSTELKFLIDDTAWSGVDHSGTRFVLQVNADGRIAIKNRSTLLVGTAWVEENTFCVKFKSNILGRNDCGFIYRNPGGSREQKNEYVWAAVGAIYYFSVVE